MRQVSQRGLKYSRNSHHVASINAWVREHQDIRDRAPLPSPQCVEATISRHRTRRRSRFTPNYQEPPISLTVIVPLIQIGRLVRLRQIAKRQHVPLLLVHGVGDGLAAGDVARPGGHVEGRVAVQIAGRGTGAGHDEGARHPRLSCGDGEVQRGLGVVVRGVQEAGVRRETDQGQRDLGELLDYRCVELSVG